MSRPPYHRPLGEVVEVASGQVDPTAPPYSLMPHVGGDNIESGSGRIVGVKTASELTLISGKYAFRAGEILYSKIRPALNKVAIPDFDGICSADIYPLRVNNSVADSRYLVYVLRSREFLAYTGQHSSRTNIPKVNRDSLLSYEVALPPLPKQRRIADVLDRAEALRAKRRAALAQLDTLTQAIFFRLFGDPFTQREGTVPLGDEADIIMGQSPPGESYNGTGAGTPLLNGPTEFGERYPLEKQWTTAPTRLCEAEDILFCVRGATAGRLNRADKTYCLGRGLAAIRPRKGQATNSDFLFAVLDRYYEYFQAKGVGSTFINIKREELEVLPIPKAQHDKADALARQVAAVEQLRSAHRASLRQLDELFASLQHRAFRGEL